MEHHCKAAFLVRQGEAEQAFEWREIAMPVAKDDEVLVAVEAFGLNFADVLARQGLYREAPPMPCVLGYDMVGRVIAIGPNVHSGWLGKRVTALTRFGAYATHIATPIIGITEVPEEMPDYAACALGTQYVTAYYSARYLQQTRKGERVLVHAALGGVGTALVQLLQESGCEIYATVGSDEKVNELKSKGIHAFNYSNVDVYDQIKNHLGKNRLDVSFNSIAGKTFKQDMKLLGANGRLLLYGFAERSGKKKGKWATYQLLWNMGIVIPIMMLAFSKSIMGVNMLKIADQKPQIIKDCLDELVTLWKQNKIAPVSGGIYKPEQLALAHKDLELRKIKGKAIIRLQ